MTVVVSMQPTYLPWLGYFDLMDQSDIFVLQESVQFEPASWQQRNFLKGPRGAMRLTLPVCRPHVQPILQMRLDNRQKWRDEHWKSIHSCYRRAAYWSTYAPELEQIYARDWPLLADLNIHLIRTLAKWLGLHKKFVRASQLRTFLPDRIEAIVALAAHCGADVYLSANGSRAYLTDDRLFRERGISVLFQSYEHPQYAQLFGEFVPHLSVLDLLLNEGDNALNVIRSGRRRAGIVNPAETEQHYLNTYRRAA